MLVLVFDQIRIEFFFQCYMAFNCALHCIAIFMIVLRIFKLKSSLGNMLVVGLLTLCLPVSLILFNVTVRIYRLYA